MVANETQTVFMSLPGGLNQLLNMLTCTYREVPHIPFVYQSQLIDSFAVKEESFLWKKI